MEIATGVVIAAVVAILTLVVTPARERVQIWLKHRNSPPGVALTVTSDFSNYPDIQYEKSMRFYLPESGPEKPDNLPQGRQWWPYWHNRGGIDLEFSSILITIQALQDASIVVDSPVLNWRRRPLPPGEAISPEGKGGGGALYPRHYAFAIRGSETALSYSDPNSPTARSPSFTLKKDDAERLLVYVYADKGLCEWSLDLPLIVNGRAMTVEVLNENRFFATVGDEGLRPVLWGGGSWFPPRY